MFWQTVDNFSLHQNGTGVKLNHITFISQKMIRMLRLLVPDLLFVFSYDYSRAEQIIFQSPTGRSSAQSIITGFTGFLISMAVILTIIVIVWAGIRFVLSGGVESQMMAAKKTLIYAILGLVLVLVAPSFISSVREIVSSPSGVNEGSNQLSRQAGDGSGEAQMVNIVSPNQEQIFSVNDTIFFEGRTTSYDGYRYVWYSDLDGYLGEGLTLSVP